jgi:hypothetical protein
MKSDINILLEKILKESLYSLEDIQKAINTNTPITINKIKSDNVTSTIAQFTVVPKSIDNGIITGESDEQGKVEFEIDEVEKIHFLDEAGIKVKMDDLSKIDASALQKIAQKSDVFITENDEEDKNLFTDIKKDIEGDKNIPEHNQQELATFNIKNWAAQLNLDLSDEKPYGQGVKEFTFIKGKRPYVILIYPDGGIRLSNHTVRTFEDFKNIINFLSDNQ